MDRPIASTLAVCVMLTVALLIPYNQVSFVWDSEGAVRLTRVDRESVLLNLGTFYTPGEFRSWFKKPSRYVNPHYINTVFDEGTFDLYVEFRYDTIIIYEGSYCEAKNLDEMFQLKRVPNAYGELSWLTISEDTTGRYVKLPVKETE